MPEPGPKPGTLIALDGTGGRRLLNEGRRLCRASTATETPAVISAWDGSHIFYQLHLGELGLSSPSPRVMLLLYAADLVFRLRWQIRPALEEGKSVIAAPYVATAMAFGRVAGLALEWLSSVFVFAPRAAIQLRIDEDESIDMPGKPLDGYIEMCHALAGLPGGLPQLRRDCLEFLKSLERRRRCATVREGWTYSPGSE